MAFFEVLSAVGLGLKGAGLLGKLFGGDDEEDERKRRKAEYARAIGAARARALSEGITQISRQTAAQMASSRQAAGRRAAAMGRSGAAESFILPGESRIATAGSEATQGFITDVEREYGRYGVEMERDWANRPIQPGWTDYAMTLGESAENIGLDMAYMNAMAEGQEGFRRGAPGGGVPGFGGMGERIKKMKIPETPKIFGNEEFNIFGP